MECGQRSEEDRTLSRVLRHLGYGPLLGIGKDSFCDAVREALSIPEPIGAWPNARVYRLRSCYPPTLLRTNFALDDTAVKALVPELIASQVNFLAERLERGKPLKPAALLRLSRTVEQLRTEFGFANADTRRIEACIRMQLPTAVQSWRPEVALPRGAGPELLSKLANGSTDWRGLARHAFTRFLDPRSGLFTLDVIDEAPKRYLTDSVVVDALIQLARALDLSLRAPEDVTVVPMPPLSAGLLGALTALAELPALPRPLSIYPPTRCEPF